MAHSYVYDNCIDVKKKKKTCMALVLWHAIVLVSTVCSSS